MSEENELRRRRLEQAEAFARTLQAQRDAAEQNATDLRFALAQATAELETEIMYHRITNKRRRALMGARHFCRAFGLRRLRGRIRKWQP